MRGFREKHEDGERQTDRERERERRDWIYRSESPVGGRTKKVKQSRVN